MKRTIILISISLGLLAVGGCGKGESESTGPKPLTEAEKASVAKTFGEVLQAIEAGRTAEADELLTQLEAMAERLPAADQDRLARYREQCDRAGGDEPVTERLPGLPER